MGFELGLILFGFFILFWKMHRTAVGFLLFVFLSFFFLNMIVTMQIEFILSRFIIAGAFSKEDRPAFWQSLCFNCLQ